MGPSIPAWFDEDGNVYVELTEEDAQKAAGEGVKLTRETDVLDTWFSSALWPFSTLGWPDKTPQLDHYYTTDVLVTGFDIIFFWVARMMMMGIHFMGKSRLKMYISTPLYAMNMVPRCLNPKAMLLIRWI